MNETVPLVAKVDCAMCEDKARNGVVKGQARFGFRLCGIVLMTDRYLTILRVWRLLSLRGPLR